ncbi:hypothetical protein [Desulfitobacterium hafniense]|nr:hypothetical protein [Desulfitobacterium hafniense]
MKPVDSQVMDDELMAFVTRTARQNRYVPDEDPVLKDFRKRMGIVKIGSK